MDTTTTSARTAYLLEDDDSIVGAYRAALDMNEVQLRHYYSPAEFFSDVSSDPHRGCLLVDLQLGNESGLDFITSIRQRGWTVPAIVISGALTIPVAMDAVENGVLSVLEKPVSAKQLISTVENALNAPRIARRNTRAELESIAAGFSKIERNVLAMVLHGKMNKVIASRLDISLRSVVRHRKRILDSLGYSNDMELAREWAAAGLDLPVSRNATVFSESAQKEIRNRLDGSIRQLQATCATLDRQADIDGIESGISQLIELKNSVFLLSAAELNKRNAELPLVVILSDSIQETYLLGNLFRQNQFIAKVCRTPSALFKTLRGLGADAPVLLLLSGANAVGELEPLARLIGNMDCQSMLQILALASSDTREKSPGESFFGERLHRIPTPYDPQELIENALETLSKCSHNALDRTCVVHSNPCV